MDQPIRKCFPYPCSARRLRTLFLDVFISLLPKPYNSIIPGVDWEALLDGLFDPAALRVYSPIERVGLLNVLNRLRSCGAIPEAHRQRLESGVKDLNHFCVVCKMQATKRCARCKHVSYCSSECQQNDWKLGCNDERPHRQACFDADLVPPVD